MAWKGWKSPGEVRAEELELLNLQMRELNCDLIALQDYIEGLL